MDFSHTALLAAQVTPPAPAPKQGFESFLPLIVIIFVVFYFVIIRPQRREQKQAQDMRGSIKKGDRVKSIGGIYGTVLSVDTTNSIVTVQVDKNVKLDFDRNAISTVTPKEEAKDAEQTKASESAKAGPIVETK